MSSMVRFTPAALLIPLSLVASPALAQDAGQSGAEWDLARARNAASYDPAMAQAIARWKLLTGSDRFGFSDYAGFLMSYPGFPEEAKLRASAERALAREYAEPSRLVAFFDRYPPQSNPARAQYALALSALRRPEAASVGREAWRGGAMSDAAEASLFAQLAATLALADHDARMNALLWDGATPQAERQIFYVSPTARPVFMARLATLQGKDPASLGLDPGPLALADPGYVYNRARQLRRTGQSASATSLFANRPRLAALPLDQAKWVDALLSVAQDADARSAVRIAASIDDGFLPGADVSKLDFALRDDYTSLMWLGGTRALWSLGDAASAVPLFYRYGAAARTPQTRSKGFYWAGRAAAQSGDAATANRFFEQAGAYADQFYGQLALERLGRPLPAFRAMPTAIPTEAERATFRTKPLTAAVREVARESDWPSAVRFFREISEQAASAGDHVLVADLARELGRRDLSVILGQSAHAHGHGDFSGIAFPLIPVPPGASWTMVHAISRQESQFAQNAVSHAGARGLMQLMPGTAREQAGKLGLAYDPGAVMSDGGYNIRLGAGYFARMMDYYGGSYPLAIAAYNAGPGNVNKWLRNNGDPRSGGIDWITWIERIPLTETRGYVQHVLENAVVYEAMNPERAFYKGATPLSNFLGKRTPG
ncbi:MAG TPA: lytic transglycosylase domain-containing protein [Novosphingobium sp.]|nr:lytic transglycosylase domain-containing protein [Novosphingobium sp.]